MHSRARKNEPISTGGLSIDFPQHKLHRSDSAKALSFECYLDSTMVILFEVVVLTTVL